jgi:hypothetical protein
MYTFPDSRSEGSVVYQQHQLAYFCWQTNKQLIRWGLLRYIIPLNGSLVVLSFFSIFYYGQISNLFDVYYLEKILRCQGYIKRLNFIYYNNIIIHIFDNTRILPIPLMNITHTILKIGGTELISTVGSLYIGHFLLHTSPFQPVV